MSIVNEVVTKFKFTGDAQPLNDFNNSLGDAVKMGVAFVASINATIGALGAYVNSITKAVSPTLALSKQTGIAIEKINELGFIASVNGSSVQAMESTMASLSQTIGDAAQQGSADFSRLGISVWGAGGQLKSADKILLEVNRSFKRMGLSMQEQQAYMSKLGIDTSLVQMFKLSAKEMSNLQAEFNTFGLTTQKQAEEMEDFNDSVTRAGFAFKGLQHRLAVEFSPVIKEIIDGFSSFLRENKQFINSSITFLKTFVTEFVDSAPRIAKTLTIMAGGFIALKVATMGWGNAIKYAGRMLKASGILAAFLAIEHFVTVFEKGGWKGVGDEIIGIITSIGDAISGLVKIINDMLLGSLSKAGEALLGIFGFGGDKDDTKLKKNTMPKVNSIPKTANNMLTNNNNSKITTTATVNNYNKIDIVSADPNAVVKALDQRDKEINNLLETGIVAGQ